MRASSPRSGARQRVPGRSSRAPRETPASIRRLFPALKRSVYLNAAASSPLATPVADAIYAHVQDTVEWGDRNFSRWLAAKGALRERYARFIGATASEVAFLSSTSMGFAILGQWLRARGIREVVTFSREFPSTTLPLLRAGLTLRAVTPDADGAFSVEDVAAALTRRTGAVALSAVQYASGLRTDLEALGALCRDRGLILAVNGSQALGQIPFDVEAQGIDFLLGASHKWMMGGSGAALFYGRGELLEETALPLAGWLSTENPMAMDPFAGARMSGKGRVRVARGARFRSEAAALEVGVGSFATLAGFGAALELLEAVGHEAIEAHNSGLQQRLREGLRRRGFVPNAPDDRCAGICVFPVRGDAQAAWRALDARDIRLTVRGGGLRVSTHLFNDEGELERFFWAIDQVKLSPAEGRS